MCFVADPEGSTTKAIFVSNYCKFCNNSLALLLTFFNCQGLLDNFADKLQIKASAKQQKFRRNSVSSMLPGGKASPPKCAEVVEKNFGRVI
jgi:hypothetical protein